MRNEICACEEYVLIVCCVCTKHRCLYNNSLQYKKRVKVYPTLQSYQSLTRTINLSIKI